MQTRGLSKVFARQHAAGKLNMFPLEDIAVALWVNQLVKEENTPVALVSERRCYRQRVCDSRAFNVLLERGAPLFIDPNATM